MYQQFHSAGYRGNQAGHDQYLRSDSQQPYKPAGYVQSVYGRNQQNQQNQQGQQGQPYQAAQAQQSPNQFHQANYRGNQAGHDQYLRADSQQPNAQPQQSQYAAQPQMMAQPQRQPYQAAQAQQSPNQFHQANYRGNQAGHDQYLRADSQQSHAQQQQSQYAVQPQMMQNPYAH